MIINLNRAIEIIGEATMYDEEEMKIIKDGLREAAQSVLFSGDKSFEERVFPIWRKTVHSILVAHGCPCSRGEKDQCFLTLPRTTQRETFAEHEILALESFISVIEQGLVSSLPNVSA